MQIEKTQGIALKSVPYKDGKRIVTIFAENRGLITLFAKKLSLKRLSLLNGLNLFALSEFVYLKGKSDLFYLKDLSLIQGHYFLREDLKYIEQASLMAKTLVISQLPNKKAPLLYALLKNYLMHIPHFKSSLVLAYSFILKLLLHEGLLDLKSSCHSCHRPALYLIKGELRCALHSPEYALNFSLLEMQILRILTYSRSFQELGNLNLTTELQTKIWQLFQETI